MILPPGPHPPNHQPIKLEKDAPLSPPSPSPFSLPSPQLCPPPCVPSASNVAFLLCPSRLTLPPKPPRPRCTFSQISWQILHSTHFHFSKQDPHPGFRSPQSLFLDLFLYCLIPPPLPSRPAVFFVLFQLFLTEHRAHLSFTSPLNPGGVFFCIQFLKIFFPMTLWPPYIPLSLSPPFESPRIAPSVCQDFSSRDLFILAAPPYAFSLF